METNTPERERNSNSKNKRRKRSSQQDSKRDVCSSRELPGKGKQAEERGRKGLGERKGKETVAALWATQTDRGGSVAICLFFFSHHLPLRFSYLLN